MTLKRFALLLILSLSVFTAAGADDAAVGAERFAAGHKLLAEADFEGALKAYSDAVAKDPDNQEYKAEHQILTRIENMRKKLSEEKDLKRWEAMLRGIHSYYCNNKLFQQAKELDQQLHRRKQNEASAVMLAETQLELGENKEVEQLLKVYIRNGASDYCRMLYGIALAREGKHGDAKALLKEKPVAMDARLGDRFQCARLYAVLGEEQEVMRRLTNVFESIPPSQLNKIKTYVRDTADFAPYVSTSQFATVLKTESKVAESKCSGGSSCGSCPSASSCGKK
jgi:tetratricopeptide (TPR) repeat protein